LGERKEMFRFLDCRVLLNTRNALWELVGEFRLPYLSLLSNPNPPSIPTEKETSEKRMRKVGAAKQITAYAIK
jgi:hypothetical protein